MNCFFQNGDVFLGIKVTNFFIFSFFQGVVCVVVLSPPPPQNDLATHVVASLPSVLFSSLTSHRDLLLCFRLFVCFCLFVFRLFCLIVAVFCSVSLLVQLE